VRFGEKLFGHTPSQRVYPREEPDDIRLMKLRAAEEARYSDDVEKIIGGYEYSRSGSHRDSSRDSRTLSDSNRSHSHPTRLSSGSLYSEVTGNPRRMAEPRQPVKNVNLLSSRFSMTTLGSDNSKSKRLMHPSATEAEAYAASVRESPEPSGPFRKTNSGSKNPFWN